MKTIREQLQEAEQIENEEEKQSKIEEIKKEAQILLLNWPLY